MITIQNFFKAPTLEQRNEIRILCKKGQSNNFFDSRIQAPLQALTCVTMAIKDIPFAPLNGLQNAATHLTSFSLRDAIKELFNGISIGFRSLVQVAVITAAVAFGFLFPAFVYRNLEKLNAVDLTFEEQIRTLQEELRNDKSTNKTLISNLRLQAGKKDILIEDRGQVINKLRSQIETKENVLIIIKKELKSKTENFEKNEGELKELNAKLTQANEEKMKIADRLSTVLQTVELEITHKQSQESSFGNLEKKLDEKENEIEALKNKLEAISLAEEESLNNIKVKLDQTEKEKEDLESTLFKLREELKLEKQKYIVQNQEPSSNDLDKELAEKKEEIAALKKIKDQLTKSGEEFLSDLTANKLLLAEAQQEKGKFETQYAQLLEELKSEKTLKEAKEQIITDLDGKLSEKIDEIATLSATVEKKLLEVDSLNNIKANLVEAEKKLVEADTNFQIMQADILMKAKTITSLTKDKVTATEKASKLETDLVQSQLNQQKQLTLNDKKVKRDGEKYNLLFQKYKVLEETFKNATKELDLLKSNDEQKTVSNDETKNENNELNLLTEIFNNELESNIESKTVSNDENKNASKKSESVETQ